MNTDVQVVNLKPVGLCWRLAVAFIGMVNKPVPPDKKDPALYERFRRWTRARGIMPDEAGLYSVKKLQQQFGS